MTKFLRILNSTAFAFLFFALLPTAWAHADARIDGLVVTRAPLKVSFQITDAFTKEIEEAIKSGIPATFNFVVLLERVNTAWFNANVGRRDFRHTIKYDTLKDEYELTIEESGERVFRTRDFGEAKRLMTTGSAIAVIPTEPLVPGSEYEFRVRAESSSASSMPLLLDYVFFFLKAWEFKTDWHTYRFSP